MSLSTTVQTALAGLPTSSLLDQGAVMDLLLDIANVTNDPAEYGRVVEAMKALPRSAVLDRHAVADLLLDLLVEPALAV